MPGHSKAALLGFATTVEERKACWKLISITKLILVQVVAVLIWLDLEMLWGDKLKFLLVVLLTVL